tara:strand:+ start:249178 stop:250173 length:996 start_codon:yes stop_codon:yes gene_type:complete
MRVLVVKLSSLGDVIHALPALTDAAAALPGIQFDWVVEEAFAEIPAWHPAVNKVIPVAIRRWRKRPVQALRSAHWRQFRVAMRQPYYDAVVDAQGLLKSALVTRMVPSVRCGMDRQSARESLASLFYHRRIQVPRQMHAVERIRLLFAKALNYPVPSGQGDYGVAASLTRHTDELPPGLLFFHGTARREKLWPEAHWIALADIAAAHGYAAWLPWGNPAEKLRAERIAAAASNAKVLPALDLLGLAGMLLQVSGAVAVDTGLAHLSAALDIPTVSLYGPTDTRLIGAYGHNQVHIQSPVGVDDTRDPLAMMQSIRPEHVWRQLGDILPELQ